MENAKIVQIGDGKSMIQLTCSKVRDGKESWFWCKKSLYSVVKNNYTIGEEVQIEYNLDKGKYWLNKVEKVAGATSASNGSQEGVYPEEGNEKSTTPPNQPTCSDCGKVLKDAKYKKCYTCYQKNPVKSTNSKAKDESIRSQAIGKMVGSAMPTFTGQIQINDVKTIIKTLYEAFDEIILKQ